MGGPLVFLLEGIHESLHCASSWLQSGMTPAVEGGPPHRRGRREGAPQVFDKKASSDPYAFIDEHVKRPSGTQQQQTERLERELEQLQLTVRRKIDLNSSLLLLLFTALMGCRTYQPETAVESCGGHATQRCFEEAEEKSLCLSRALPEALATVETLGSEACRSQAAAKRLLASLEATGAHQQEGLGTLYVLQAVKKQLEDCSKIVAELHRWHFRQAARMSSKTKG
ncbi:hypothetical protein Emag_000665 [Eimeria magna]